MDTDVACAATSKKTCDGLTLFGHCERDRQDEAEQQQQVILYHVHQLNVNKPAWNLGGTELQHMMLPHKSARVLGKLDVPFLRDEILLWQKHFGFKIERSQLISWAQYFSHDNIRRAFAVTAAWAKKKPDCAATDKDLYRFTNGTLRHMADNERLCNELLGEEL